MRTSSGMPDQAQSRSSESGMELACRRRLNLLMRDMRVEWASDSLGGASWGREGWLMRLRVLTGSKMIVSVVGRKRSIQTTYL